MNGKQSCPGCGEIIKYTKDNIDSSSSGWIDLPKILPRLVWKGDMPSHLPYIWVKDSKEISKEKPSNVYKRNENWSQRSYTKLELLRMEKRFGNLEISKEEDKEVEVEVELEESSHEDKFENDKILSTLEVSSSSLSSLKPLICKRCVDINDKKKSDFPGYIDPLNWIDIFSKINPQSSLLLLIDLTDLSFNENLKSFISLLYEKANPPKDIVLIGTKMDCIPKYLQDQFLEKMLLLSKEYLPSFCIIKSHFGFGKKEFMNVQNVINSIEGKEAFLIGGCNVGKSSLWNHLTISGVKVTTSNMSGTTQKPIRGILKSKNNSIWIYDLPGIQSNNSFLIKKDDVKTFLMKRCPRFLTRKAFIGESILIGQYFRIDFDSSSSLSSFDKSSELMVKCYINKEIPTLRKRTTNVITNDVMKVAHVFSDVNKSEFVFSGGIGWASLHFPPKSSNLRASIFSPYGMGIYPFKQSSARFFHSKPFDRNYYEPQSMTIEQKEDAISRLEKMAPPPEINDHRSAIQRLAQQQAELENRKRGDPLELINPSKEQRTAKVRKWKGRY